MQRGACQADRAQHLAALLRQARKHMLDAGARAGDTPVAALLGLGQRFVLAAFALDMHAPAFVGQPLFALLIDVALVGVDIAAGVERVQHVLEVQGVVLAAGADLDLADQLAALVGAERELVAKIGFAVLLGPARIDILLAPLRRRPVGRHGVVFDHGGFFLLAKRLPRRQDDGSVDHLATTGNIAVLGQLAIDSLEYAFAGARLDQAFLESPDCGAVGDLAGVAQAGKALETEPVQQLELHLLVRQIEQLLDQQDTHHDFCGKWRASAALTAWAWRCLIDRRRHGGEIDMPLQHLQRVTQLGQLGFSLLGGKQAWSHHGVVIIVAESTSCHHCRDFSMCPIVRVLMHYCYDAILAATTCWIWTTIKMAGEIISISYDKLLLTIINEVASLKWLYKYCPITNK